MECEPCLDGYGNVLLLIVSFLVLLALSSFTVRSGIPLVVRSRLSSTMPRIAHASNSTGSLPEGLGLMSLYCLGRVPRSVDESVPKRPSVNEASAEEAELAKWKAAELFKVQRRDDAFLDISFCVQMCVNYLQVTAVAISINVDWTSAIIALFRAAREPSSTPESLRVVRAEFTGGLTSGAAISSVDCLMSDRASLERSVANVLVDLSLPLVAIFVFVIVWSVAKVRHGEGMVFLLKRASLSAIAVLYISYISLSKTLANVLNCVEVHTADDPFAEGTTYRWTVDTSVHCYEGSHTLLAAAVGWPFLVIFSVGFPVAMAAAILKQVKADYKKGWIYDVASFMYRSYKRQYRFWESIVMLRKALLAGVVVFSYQLEANLQQVLSVFVLSLAL